MKRSIVFIVAVIIVIAAYAGPGEEEKEAIRAVIQTAYVDGLQNKGDLEMTKVGFHEGFNLLGINNNSLTKFPIYSWIEYAEKKKHDNPVPPTEEELVTCKYLDIDVTGNAAVAKIELHRDGKHIFTDYLSLYKFEEGWRIVSKIYYRIPDEG